MPQMDGELYITSTRLPSMMRDAQPPLLIDCRSAFEYRRVHIAASVNVALPASAIMLRRLEQGRMNLPCLVRGDRERFFKQWKKRDVVIYDTDTEKLKLNGLSVLSTLFKRLQQEGCRVYCLKGGFESFKKIDESCHWLETGDGADPELSLAELHLSSSDDGEEEDAPFPVEILPYLLLGNASNASDPDVVKKHRISAVLNVTADLPNTFAGSGIRYMQIPVHDHLSQNLAAYFTDAIAFIDEARQKKECILVHCLAGISRSVTITLAYIMQKFRMPLNDAFDFVRQRKANVSPNFNFMGQLMDFEGQLNITPRQCSCQVIPCHCVLQHIILPNHTTPDSGIDVDRWT